VAKNFKAARISCFVSYCSQLKAQCQPSNERALALAAFLLPLHL
jgi:hypothetical protein